ncbi:AAA family ATPase [Desulfobacter curvatus]|uniref:AAA family ATPase n=1 Tax=Desulfobacter curvatus TaxID=2290 RepID=UPI00036AC101|nr:AAA family ATPase [Desulfobacter curvatus]
MAITNQSFGGDIPPVVVDSALDLLKSRMSSIAEAEFRNKAKELHGLDLKPEVDEEDAPCSINFDELHTIDDEPDFIGSPYFIKGEVSLVTAKANVGKSLFSMLIALMLSTGRSIGQMISAIKQCKTYILDAEMAEKDFKRRFKKMFGNFLDKEAITNNFRYNCLKALEKKQNIDLSNPEDQAWVREMIGDAEFVVFDNLDLLVSSRAVNNQELWKKVFTNFFKDLALEGRSVVLIHHENKNGVHRGSGKITDDVDVVLSLVKSDYCTDEETIMDIYTQKGRNIYGSQRKPLKLEFYHENGLIKYRIEPHGGGASESQSDDLLSKEEAQRHPIQVAMIKAAREAEENTDLEPEDRFIQKKDIDYRFPGRSDTNIRDHFKILRDEKILKMYGTGKGAKYYVYPGPKSLP